MFAKGNLRRCRAYILGICTYFIPLFIVLYVNPVKGQDSLLTVSDSSSQYLNSVSVGVSTGTHALLGIDAAVEVNRLFNARLGYHHLRFMVDAFRISASDFGFSDQSLLIDSEVSLTTFGLLAEFTPTVQKNLRVVGGVMTGFNNSIDVVMRFQDSYALNDYIIAPEQLGTIRAKYSNRSAIYPYLGIGVGRSVPRNKLSFSADFGAFMRGRPKIAVNSDGLLAGNEHIGPILENSLRAWRWHPNVSLRIAYRINFRKGYTKEDFSDFNAAEEELVAAPETGSTEEPTASPLASEESKNQVPTPASTSRENTTKSSPYISIEGSVFAENGTEPLDYIFVHVYLQKDGAKGALERTGRHLNGRFKIGLAKDQSYILEFEHHLYQKLSSKIRLDDETSAQLKKDFYLTPK